MTRAAMHTASPAKRRWQPTMAHAVIVALLLALVVMGTETHLTHQEMQVARQEAARARMLVERLENDQTRMNLRIWYLERRMPSR